MSKSSRVFIIAPYFPPSHSSGANRLYYLAKLFYENEFNVTVLTVNGLIEISEYKLLNLEKERILNQENNKKNNNVILAKNLSFIGKPYVSGVVGKFLRYVKENMFFDLLDPISFIILTKLARLDTLRLISSLQEGDFIVSSSPPFLIHIISGVICKLTNAHHLVDFRDQWALHPAKQSVFLVNLIKQKLEEIIIQSSDACFTVSQGISREFIEQYGKTFKTAFNSVDPEEINHALQLAHNPEYTSYVDLDQILRIHQDKTIITYTGSLAPKFYDLDSFLSKVNKLKELISELFFLFIGDNDLLERKLNKKFPHLKKDFFFKPRIHHTSALFYCIKSDFCLYFSLEGSLKVKGLLTSKIWEYIAINSKLITFNLPENSEAKELLNNNFIRYADMENLDLVVNFIKANKSKELKTYQEKIFSQRVSYKRNLAEFITTVNNLAKQSNKDLQSK